MFSSSFRILVGLMAGGCAIGIPTYICTKSNGIFTESNPVSVTSSSNLSSQERQFYNCLDSNNQVKVTEKGSQRTFIVPLSEADKYLGKSEWEVDSTYKGQCQQYSN